MLPQHQSASRDNQPKITSRCSHPFIATNSVVVRTSRVEPLTSTRLGRIRSGRIGSSMSSWRGRQGRTPVHYQCGNTPSITLVFLFYLSSFITCGVLRGSLRSGSGTWYKAFGSLVLGVVNKGCWGTYVTIAGHRQVVV
jgi:hypothetical protein